jgi:pyruvate dehydrogenase E1 component beta subunit
MTGVAVGAAIAGLKPVMTHQRLDFFLLAMDQLVNSAAKWHYMFGGQFNVPLTIRLVIGRGWGQGPTHSQNLQAWFSHIPGLKVVMPTTPSDAKGLLLASIADPNPVIFLEHRWLHHISEHVPENSSKIELGKARVVRKGDQITIVSSGFLVIESMKAADYLRDHEISCEVIDLRSLNPIDWTTIFESVEKTGRILAIDSASITGSIAGEIVAMVTSKKFSYLKSSPDRIALPDVPEPTSYGLTKRFYVTSESIIMKIYEMMGLNQNFFMDDPENRPHHDVPNELFRGPF